MSIMRAMVWSALVAMALAGCVIGGDEPWDDNAGGDADTDTDSDGDNDTDTDVDTDTDIDTDTDGDGDSDSDYDEVGLEAADDGSLHLATDGGLDAG